jgi:hypothetical protein
MDSYLSRIDKVIHFNYLPSNLLHFILGYPKITLFIDFCYLAWGSIFIYSLLYMACHKNRPLRIQFFLSLALCWIILGNVLAVVLSSAGPCYFSEVTKSPINPYTQLFDYLKSIPGLKAVGIQSSIWNAFQAGIFMPLGGISAMPSMHVSVATLLALLYKNLGKWRGLILTSFAVIIQLGSIHLGWHYAVDGYLSAIITIIIWKSVGLRLKGRNSGINEDQKSV